MLGQAKDILGFVLILPLICYLALKSSCHLFIDSFPIFCLPWLFFFLIPFFFKSHQGWDCHILADFEVPCITLSQTPCRISTVPAVPYVNIWEFSKLKFRDPKVLKIVFQVGHSVLVFSWEFSKYIFYTKAQYAVIMTTTNCQSLRKKSPFFMSESSKEGSLRLLLGKGKN